MAIPLVALVGLLAYLAGTTINNAINLDRAPNLINATSLPTAKFVNFLQSERTAAVVYLFQPTPENLAAYNAAVNATNADQPEFIAAMNSPETKGSASPAMLEGIRTVVGSLDQLNTLRGAVRAGPQALTPLKAFGAYSLAIANEPKLFLAEADSLTDPTVAHQALALIATVSAREALSQEAALLSGTLAGRRMTQADRAAFTEAAATRQGDTADYQALFSPGNLAAYNGPLKSTQAQQQDLAQIEQAVVGGLPVTKLPITLAQWQALSGSLLQAHFNAGIADSAYQLAFDHRITKSAWTRVALIGGIGLLGLLVTITVTTLVGRGIIRRLGGLERNALQLAEVQLPDVVGRLRRGDDVDVASEAPPLRVGQDEIGRVGQAFDLVRQTAIRAAVDEAKLRRGLNDVFRSLARRSQSLLHRQLTLLDQMERRASDPEALDDLFRLDHLTTRMRRHAEGLVILAGAPPGRGWSNPVRMVDVMRGAIAEVEDYARVSVATRSQAALSGPAVADVIHLLAELIENATTLSPPYTSVRVAGETVASGFAIEVEDRGLGMSQQRLAELNERLAHPPEFNPSDSEQLGLFVVGQLAKRHGIRVTLKASPYGGTSAVVLIPQHLVVTEDTYRAELPGEAAAITMTPARTNGTGGGNGAGAGYGTGGGYGSSQPGFPQLRGGAGPAGPGAGDTGIRISGALRRSGGPPNGAAGPQDLPRRPDQPAGTPPGGAVPTVPGGAVPGDAVPTAPGGAGPADFDVFMPRRPGSPPYQGTGAVPSGSSPYPDQPGSFPAWGNRNAGSTGPGGPGGAGGPVGGAVTPMTPVTPVASPAPKVSGPPWELSRQTGPLPAVPAEPGGDGDYKGLPRRVKQASLAPQLRDDPPHLRTAPGGGLSGGPSPAEIRKTMSALQRGWQEGRSQQPFPGPEPGGDAGTPDSTASDSGTD